MNASDELCINTLRFLAVDAVEAARSGHPGLPLGAAPMMYVVWDRFLRHNPRNPAWIDRDRFVFSPGHGCALLYAMLHLTGHDLPLEELRRFRQWGSRTPGHPEYGVTPGVEATTGPLGQGFGMGVGMAMAEAHLRSVLNREGFPFIDHYTYGLVSDGDLMEGVASEAASLAGRVGLGRLIYLYDANGITIEGSTDLAFTENVPARFEAYGWHTARVEDGNDLEAIERAIHAARGETRRPSLILVRTHIGYGSPKQDTAGAHGEPLGPEAARATKQALGWPQEPRFHVPEEARARLHRVLERGEEAESRWQTLLREGAARHPDLAARLEDLREDRLPAGWDADLPSFRGEPMATREASGKVLNALAPRLPGLLGGSADLAPSTKTLLKGAHDFGPEPEARNGTDGGGDGEVDDPEDRGEPAATSSSYRGRNVRFGVREHAMGAAVNGLALHGGIVPYGASFLTFSDYMRPSIRIAALMQSRSIFVFTHDSVGLGEDGPTHQPVEQLMSLRAIPGLTVFRPADANETAAAWKLAVARRRPAVLALSRQKLPVLDPDRYPIAAGVPRGGYVLAEAEGGGPDIILLATGGEVALILEARGALAAEGIRARCVSLPSLEIFREQPEAYRREVLPPGTPRLSVEAGSPLGWREIVGDAGDVIGLDRFGASAPGTEALEKLGFNVPHVLERALRLLRKG